VTTIPGSKKLANLQSKKFLIFSAISFYRYNLHSSSVHQTRATILRVPMCKISRQAVANHLLLPQVGNTPTKIKAARLCSPRPMKSWKASAFPSGHWPAWPLSRRTRSASCWCSCCLASCQLCAWSACCSCSRSSARTTATCARFSADFSALVAPTGPVVVKRAGSPSVGRDFYFFDGSGINFACFWVYCYL